VAPIFDDGKLFGLNDRQSAAASIQALEAWTETVVKPNKNKIRAEQPRLVTEEDVQLAREAIPDGEVVEEFIPPPPPAELKSWAEKSDQKAGKEIPKEVASGSDSRRHRRKMRRCRRNPALLSGRFPIHALVAALISSLTGLARSTCPEAAIGENGRSWTASAVVTFVVGIATLLYMVWRSSRRKASPPEDGGNRVPTITYVFVDDNSFHTDGRCARLREGSAASSSEHGPCVLIRWRCLCCWIPANAYEERRLADLRQAESDRLEYEQYLRWRRDVDDEYARDDEDERNTPTSPAD
jgi:hypothetical protein